VIDQWLPRGTVTALFGGGGIGKSLLIQQAATCIANGIGIFGATVTRGPVLAYLCEDDNNEVRRRQRDLLAYLGRSPAYSADGLHVAGRAGCENVMLTFGADRLPVPGPFLATIERECERIRPSALMLDNIAQLFGGIENDRYMVTAFANLLAGIAHRHDCAVLLLGHNAKAQGSEYSGSTAWEAAVRTRLWMERREDGLIELHRRKANYAGQASAVMEYQHGALVEIDESRRDESAAARAAEPAVLEALAMFTARQVATSHVPTARTYLVTLATKHGLLKVPAPIAARALAAMIDAGRIVPNAELPWRKADRHRAIGLAVAPESEAGNA
jgi:RecA-family ATPase